VRRGGDKLLEPDLDLCVPKIRFGIDAGIGRRNLADLMTDLLKLILGLLASLFKSRANLEAEVLILRQQSMCFAGGCRSDRI
jgi:hypothetical protein